MKAQSVLDRFEDVSTTVHVIEKENLISKTNRGDGNFPKFSNHYGIKDIDKRVYGSFVEHLGRAVYGGIYD